MSYIEFDRVLVTDPVKLANLLNLLQRSLRELASPVQTLDVVKVEKRTQVLAGVAMKGGGPLESDVRLDLQDTGVTPGPYANPVLTVDQQGRIIGIASGTTGESRLTFRAGIDAVTSAGTAIMFSSNMPDDSVEVIAAACYNNLGISIGVDITNVTKSGFIATPSENATLEWIALPADLARNFSLAIQAAGTFVPFSLPFANTNYVIYIKSCHRPDGTEVGVTWANKQVGGFTANPTEDATIVGVAYPVQ